MLEVKHISKRFGEHQVLADVSLKVNQGDVVVILGPSGSALCPAQSGQPGYQSSQGNFAGICHDGQGYHSLG